MNKVKVNIWGRDFELDVIFQTFSVKPVIENQKTILERIPTVDFDESKAGVEQYIRKYHAMELGTEEIDNIFRYVMPKSIFILRNPEARVFAVMCRYRFDIEHGIAVVFKNEKFKEAGPQDIIL